MGHVTRETNWCVIDIDTTVGRIFLQQRWQYLWLLQPPLSNWTHTEKRDFHNRADREIWAAWSNRASLNVTGSSTVARRFRGRGLPINLDIRWVTAKPHWRVHVMKLPSGQFRTSSVRWTARLINLDTNDFSTRTIGTGTPTVTTQVPVAHEFGHAAGNTAVLSRGDEYKSTSPNKGDQASIMHSGHQLRNRHFRTILDEMNKMIPDTTFSVRSL